MNHIRLRHGGIISKTILKISTKYHQLVEKCDGLQIQISCILQLIDFN